MEAIISQIDDRNSIAYCRQLLDKQERLISKKSIDKGPMKKTVWLEIPKFTTSYYEISLDDYYQLTDEKNEWLSFTDDITIKSKNTIEPWRKINIINMFKKLGPYWNQEHHHLWRRKISSMKHNLV